MLKITKRQFNQRYRNPNLIGRSYIKIERVLEWIGLDVNEVEKKANLVSFIKTPENTLIYGSNW